MKVKSFDSIWNDVFQNTIPLAHNLKYELDGWIRFHTLPLSKRYPESGAEMAIILSRHKQILDLLCTDSVLYLVTAEWNNSAEDHHARNIAFEEKSYGYKYWRTVQDDTEAFCHLYVSSIDRNDKAFSEMIKLVADDKISNVMLLPNDFSWIYHPYDGGVDVFASSDSTYSILLKKFADWLAPEWLSQH